jgi:SWI/SNF-related matrix-associated actin-dependent regulator of chromatin subfamily A-like protein 1
MKNPYKLLPFQRQGVDYIKERKYSLLADSMGLGKTIQSLSAALELGAKKILIICPTSIVPQWIEKAREFFPDYFFETFTNKPLQSRHFSKFILVSGYNRAGSHQGKLKLLQLQYDFVIIDEMHFLKNPEAQRTKNILGGKSICTVTGKESPGSFLENANQVCLMSGTPILNRPSEAYIILKAFAPKSLGKYLPWPIFIRRFCGFQAKGATHTDELATILSAFILRRTKEQVLTELPPVVESIVHIKGIHDPEEEFLPTRRKLVSLAKVDFTIEYVKDILQTIDKVFLVAYHRETIQKLQEAFKGSVVLQGGMTSEQKQSNINKFTTEDNCNVLIGQISVAGYGIDGLQNVCNYIIFAELDWSPGILEQAKDRLRRMGQRKTVFAHYLIASNTIEEEIDLRLEWKREVISKLIIPALVEHKGKMTMDQALETLAIYFAEKVVEKILASGALSAPTSKAAKPPKPAVVEAVVSHPDVIPDPPTPDGPVPANRADITVSAQTLLKDLKENGVPKEDADSYYKNVILDGLGAKKIAELNNADLTILQSRLKDHDMPSALAFLLPTNNVAQETDEV